MHLIKDDVERFKNNELKLRNYATLLDRKERNFDDSEKKLMDFKQMLKIPRGKDRQDSFYSIYHALCYAETKTTEPYKNDDELRKELPDGFFNK